MTVTDKELYSKIEPLVHQAFAGFGIAGVEVKSDLDHDGDPIVSVIVRLKSAEKKYPPEVSFLLAREVLRVLNELGDTRFPIVGVYYPSDEPTENLYPERRERRTRRAGRG